MELIMNHSTQSMQALWCNMRTKILIPPDIVEIMEKTPTQTTLIENLEMLMTHTRMKPSQLAEKSGVSIRMIYFVLNGEKAPSINVTEKLASAFKLKAWHLVLPSLPQDIKKGGEIEKLIKDYLGANSEGSQHILQVAKKQAEYAALQTLVDELKTAKPRLDPPTQEHEPDVTRVNVHAFRNKRIGQTKFQGKDRRKHEGEDNG